MRTLAAVQSSSNSLEVGDVQWRARNEHVIRTFGLSIQLQIVDFRGTFLRAEEPTRKREESIYEFGSIVGQQVVLYAIWDNLMVEAC